jgi:AAHS family 4-hydroxybenzoate transporter-like MFS transporter
MTDQTADVDAVLDTAAFGRFHVQVLILGAIIMLVDGFEVGVLGLVLPKLAEGFGVKPVSLTWVMTSQQVGMVLGAYLLSPLADRYGRRPLALLALIAVGLSSFVTVFTHSLVMLAAWRLVTGMFASTLIANLVAWTSEMAPKRFRALMIAVILTGSSAGALLGSAVQAFVLEPFGWRGAFWVGAATPLVLAPLTFFFFQESPRFLAVRRPDDPRLHALLRRLRSAAASAVAASPAATVAQEPGRVGDLFAAGLAPRTILLWLTYICSFVAITASFWKTTVFHDLLHLGWHLVALTTTVEMIASAVGMLTVGALIARFGSRTVVPTSYAVSCAAFVLVGLLAPSWGMFAALALATGMQQAGHAGLALIASTLYPTRSRALGVGWAYGAGRVASMFGPPFGAIALKNDWSALGYFLLLGAPLMAAAITAYLLLSRHPTDRAPALALAH